MDNAVSFKAVVCPQYETLLKECQAVLDAWDDRREEIEQSHLSGKEFGDELLRLQADYARTYTVLRGHVRDCEICQFFIKSSAHSSKYGLHASSRRELPDLGYDESKHAQAIDGEERRTDERNSGIGTE